MKSFVSTFNTPFNHRLLKKDKTKKSLMFSLDTENKNTNDPSSMPSSLISLFGFFRRSDNCSRIFSISPLVLSSCISHDVWIIKVSLPSSLKKKKNLLSVVRTVYSIMLYSFFKIKMQFISLMIKKMFLWTKNIKWYIFFTVNKFLYKIKLSQATLYLERYIIYHTKSCKVFITFFKFIFPTG